jgi:hypothetical protein
MTIDERARHELFLAAERTLGRHQTETLMELLPTRRLGRGRTKHDLSALEEQISLRFDLVDQKFDMVDQRFEALELRLDQKFDMVDQRFEALELRLDQRFTAQEGQLAIRDDSLSVRFDLVDQKFDTQTAYLLGELDRRFKRADPDPVPEPGRVDDLADDAPTRRAVSGPTTGAGRATGRRPSPGRPPELFHIGHRCVCDGARSQIPSGGGEREVEAQAHVMGVQGQLERAAGQEVLRRSHLDLRAQPDRRPRLGTGRRHHGGQHPGGHLDRFGQIERSCAGAEL